MEGAIGVTEAGEFAVLRDIQAEAIARQVIEIFFCLPARKIEALYADLVVAVPCQYQALLWDESH